MGAKLEEVLAEAENDASLMRRLVLDRASASVADEETTKAVVEELTACNVSTETIELVRAALRASRAPLKELVGAYRAFQATARVQGRLDQMLGIRTRDSGSGPTNVNILQLNISPEDYKSLPQEAREELVCMMADNNREGALAIVRRYLPGGGA